MPTVMPQTVPFCLPYVDHRERDAMAVALESGVLHGNGEITARVKEALCRWLDIRHVSLTTSCTHALEMAMIALGIGPGNEVIMPSFTFVSTANAVVLRGATPVFAEIQPDTLNLDPEDVAHRITPNTKAIMPVHYAGVGCDMDALLQIARDAGCAVIEDAAQAVDAKYRGQYLGTIGDIGCFSFHDTKNITCGEGGALLTNDPEIAERAEIISEKGTNRGAFLRGQVDKYSWVSMGSSYIPSEVLVAMLEVQLAKRSEIRQRRDQLWHAYLEALRPLATDGWLTLPRVPEECETNYHAFFIRTNTPQARDSLLRQLRSDGIEATFHYIPLHSSPFGRATLKNHQELPVTDLCSQTLIRLPLYPSLVGQEASLCERVMKAIKTCGASGK